MKNKKRKLKFTKKDENLKEKYTGVNIMQVKLLTGMVARRIYFFQDPVLWCVQKVFFLLQWHHQN
jgi:hypothetical protein